MNDSRQRLEHLMMKAVDGMLTPQEKFELDGRLVQDPQAQKELLAFQDIKASTDALADRIFMDAALDPIERHAPLAVQRRELAGLALLALGSLRLLGYGLYALLFAAQLPFFLQLSLCGAGLGLALLFAQIAWRRMRTPDPYKEIDL